MLLCFLPGPPSTPVTARLVPAATEDALGLLIDDGKAGARATAAPPPRLGLGLGLGQQLRVSMSPPGSEVAGAKATSPSGPGAVEAREPARVGVRKAGPEPPALDACAAGNGREGESGLRWRLWHKGEVRSVYGLDFKSGPSKLGWRTRLGFWARRSRMLLLSQSRNEAGRAIT